MAVVLGISAFYHDSAAAVVVDGRIAAAAQEERFSRLKNDARFPAQAVRGCLRSAGLTEGDVDAVYFYEKPIVKFTRSLEVFLSAAPRGLGSFVRAMPGWLAERLDVRGEIRRRLPGLPERCRTGFVPHHASHAASAFLPSPFDRAAVLTIDGVGEWATTVVGAGTGGGVTAAEELVFPHSLGLLYSAFTAYCGFRVNSGEYKLMGLAPYGTPRFRDEILAELIDLRDDGSFRLNLGYFDFLHPERMTGSSFDALFGGPPRREGDGQPVERFADVAASAQAVAEEVMLKLAARAVAAAGSRRLCLAGGVALNSVANGRLIRSGIADELWVQPAAGDAGGALGAALLGAADLGDPRCGPGARGTGDAMGGALLGPEATPDECQRALGEAGVRPRRMEAGELEAFVASEIAAGKVVGWVQGRMEFGPRALGNRSILADPRRADMRDHINREIKFREDFRPFAPVVLAGDASRYFEIDRPSPYMQLVVPARERAGADLPAVVHVDGSARIQTVSDDGNPRLAGLVRAFGRLTGAPVLLNTSFNVRGEPMVASAADAIACFEKTGLDLLVLGDFVVTRDDLPAGRYGRSGGDSTNRDPAPARRRWTPTLSENRSDWLKFAVSSGLALSLLLGIVWLRSRGGGAAPFPAWLVALPAATLPALSLASRRWARAFYRCGMTALGAVGHRVGQLLLAATFALVVTPTGLALRLAGRRPIDTTFRDPGRATYWNPASFQSDTGKMY